MEIQDRSILPEGDRKTIITHFREQYEAVCDICGKESEEAKQAKDSYKKLLAGPLEDCRDDIFNFYSELSDAVGGRIEECYQSEPELADMIKNYGGINEQFKEIYNYYIGSSRDDGNITQ